MGAIHESDMLLIPDPNTAFMDPFRDDADIGDDRRRDDPLSRKPYERDPRNVAKRAEEYLAKSGIADQAFFGAEAEFFIFDSVRFDQAHSTVSTTSIPTKAAGTRGAKESRQANLGYRHAIQGGILPRSAERPLPGSAHGHGFEDAGSRHGRGMPSPRSGHRRAVRKSTSNSTR